LISDELTGKGLITAVRWKEKVWKIRKWWKKGRFLLRQN